MSPKRVARLFISTGEVSGDLQAALLIQALQRQASQAGVNLEILALGGDRMAQAGATLIANTTTIGAIGAIEALRYVWPTLRIQSKTKQLLRQHPPDLVLLIDYMGGNLSMGSFARQQLQVPVAYYIAPQEWVWSSSLRATSRIIQFTTHLLAIFPGEANYYQAQAEALAAPLKVSWVGHPLVEALQAAPDRQTARDSLGIGPEQIAIALLPASRQQEMKYLLPVIFRAAQRIQAQLPQVHFWVPFALKSYRARLEAAIQSYGLRATLASDPQTALAAADLAIAKSGTVNLEAALLNVPQVVVYRLSPITAWVARHLLKLSLPFVSPVNLVEMRAVVPELLQEQANPDQIAQTALELLLNPARRQQILGSYERIHSQLGGTGATDRAAHAILQLLIKKV